MLISPTIIITVSIIIVNVLVLVLGIFHHIIRVSVQSRYKSIRDTIHDNLELHHLHHQF